MLFLEAQFPQVFTDKPIKGQFTNAVFRYGVEQLVRLVGVETRASASWFPRFFYVFLKNNSKLLNLNKLWKQNLYE